MTGGRWHCTVRHGTALVGNKLWRSWAESKQRGDRCAAPGLPAQRAVQRTCPQSPRVSAHHQHIVTKVLYSATTNIILSLCSIKFTSNLAGFSIPDDDDSYCQRLKIPGGSAFDPVIKDRLVNKWLWTFLASEFRSNAMYRRAALPPSSGDSF